MFVSMDVTPLNFAAGVEFASTYTQMDDTPLLEVVPATTCTGEVTVAPFVGVQMVTDGSAVFNVHCAWAREGNARRSRPARTMVRVEAIRRRNTVGEGAFRDMENLGGTWITCY